MRVTVCAGRGLHPRCAGLREKLLGLRNKPFAAAFRTEVVRLAAVLGFGRRFLWVNHHSADGIFRTRRGSKNRQNWFLSARTRTLSRHGPILDDSGARRASKRNSCLDWYNLLP